MVKPTMISEAPVSMAEVKEELDKIKKRDKELNFRATRTEEYLGQFTTLSAKKAQELYKKIEDLKIPRLKETHILKIIDILPESPEALKVVLQGYTLTVNNENIKKISAVISEFTK